ncbi:mCG147337 [Mus musculus]|nr:mCG147337 [Mus musculus]
MTVNTRTLSGAQSPRAKPLILLPAPQKFVEGRGAMKFHQWGFYRNHSTPGLDTKETSGQSLFKELPTEIGVSREHAAHSTVVMSL